MNLLILDGFAMGSGGKYLMNIYMRGNRSERPDTWVTLRTEYIGNTSSLRGGSYAFAGVFGNG